MRVLVTGAAGFIGSNLVRMLHSRAEVIGIDDLSTGSLSNLSNLDLEFVRGSVLDKELLSEVIRGCDAVVHLAAIPSVPRSLDQPYETHHANATGTLRVLEASQRLKDPIVIVASSSSVYGANDKSPKQEDDHLRPLSPYAVSKLASEQYALAWQHSFGVKTLALRFFNVYGPGQSAGHSYAAAIPSFLSAALSDQPIIINGDGLQTRDFTYVSSVCEALCDAISKRITHPNPVNLAFGTSTSLLQVVSELENLLSRKLDIVYRPARLSDVRHSKADPSRFLNLFPNIKAVEISVGLRETHQWMMSSFSPPLN